MLGVGIALVAVAVTAVTLGRNDRTGDHASTQPVVERPCGTGTANRRPREHRAETEERQLSARDLREVAGKRSEGDGRSAATRLAGLSLSKNRLLELWRIRKRFGAAALVDVLQEWESLGQTEDRPRVSAIRLGRSVARLATGDHGGAARDLCDAVAEMSPVPGFPSPSGASGLSLLPLGDNVELWSAGERVAAAVPPSIGVTNFWIYWARVVPSQSDPRQAMGAYHEWLEEVADTSSDAEIAMAAEIWLHAIELESPYFVDATTMPRAARRLLEASETPVPTELPAAEQWARFDAMVVALAERGDAAARDLLAEYRRGDEAGRSRRQSAYIWSLRQRVLVACPEATSPRAAKLRKLAEDLTRE